MRVDRRIEMKRNPVVRGMSRLSSCLILCKYQPAATCGTCATAKLLWVHTRGVNRIICSLLRCQVWMFMFAAFSLLEAVRGRITTGVNSMNKWEDAPSDAPSAEVQ